MYLILNYLQSSNHKEYLLSSEIRKAYRVGEPKIILR